MNNEDINFIIPVYILCTLNDYESASLFSLKQYKAAEIYFDISSRFIFVGNESFARPQTPTNFNYCYFLHAQKTLPLMKRVKI